jgi:ketosteroid isomerase-like protein
VDERDLSAVRRAYAAWNEHDVDAFVEQFSPEVEMHSYMLRLLPQSKFVGREGIRRWAVAVREPWREFVVEPLGFYSLGDRVLVAVRLRGHLEGGDAPVEARLGHLMSVRDAKIVRFEAFGSVEDAAAAAGVSRDELASHVVEAPHGRPPG